MPVRETRRVSRRPMLDEQQQKLLADTDFGLFNEWNDNRDLCPVCLPKMIYEIGEKIGCYPYEQVENYLIEGKHNWRNAKWLRQETDKTECDLCGATLAEKEQ